MLNPLTILLILVSLALLVLLVFTLFRLSNLKKRFRPVIDVAAEHDRLASERDNLEKTIKARRDEWNKEFEDTIAELERLTKELDLAREEEAMQSFGLYKPRYDFDTSDSYKEKLDSVRRKQKQMIRDKDAAVCQVEWTIEGSAAKGRQMVNKLLKLQLRAFNGECDAAVTKVKYNNVVALETRITRSFEAVNKLGAANSCEIVGGYLDLKLEELHLAHEYQVKRHEEKEEQRQIREQMREEEKAQRELESAQREAEKEEQRYDQALIQARAELEEASDAKRSKLEDQIQTLQQRLEEAHANKERALSRAQMTKSGHVYVISNIGSFGEEVYKIGMTRRLEPLDRVRELGDASVPFPFDIHAMMFSKNAPELENRLHKTFDDRRLNLVNTRKEFFAVRLQEIEAIAKEHDGEVTFTKLAEAEEFRRTQSIRREREKNQHASAESSETVSDARSALERRRALWNSTP